jgi:succinyl-diaminopimelate desuccinylase
VTLPTLRDQPNPLEQARSDQPSVIGLARRLIQIPSRAGVDPYEPILAELEAWLRRHQLQPRLLLDDSRPVGLVCDVVGDQPGPHLVLDACVDTAPFGDERQCPAPHHSSATAPHPLALDGVSSGQRVAR